MHWMLVRHKVRDVAQFKRVFEANKDAAFRAAFGPERMFRSLDDPNEVFVEIEVKDLAKAKAFTQAPPVPQAKEDGGVIGEPQAWGLESL